MNKTIVNLLLLILSIAAPGAFANTPDISNGNDSIDFKMHDLHGKWLMDSKTLANGDRYENSCLQSTMAYEKYGKPYFCNSTIGRDGKVSSGIMFYLPTNIYLEPNNPYTTITILYTLWDGTKETRNYFVEKVDNSHDNVVQFIAPQHVEDFIYYAPTAQKFDISYISYDGKNMTFSIINPMFDKNGHLNKHYKVDE